ncbi:immunoglobulin-like domain-containing protein [Aminipila sp.]|uniref:immunoglobulin-like domain-containing protein n=1 Tax=Aminipila sp. TaxID=2060095 RepID=UPI0028A19F7A|nr:immunoglobulin-like domain-containing protein [Aminipila sp.]
MFFEMNKVKKALVIILTIAIIFTGFCIPEAGNINVYADEVTTGSSGNTSEPSAGDGSNENPYVIKTADELAWFAEEANKNLKLCAVLGADINMGGESRPWTPIGTGVDSQKPYTGAFDGKGHTVSGIYINYEGKYLGFFGNLGSGGIVKNLTVKGKITTNADRATYSGGVVGCANGGSQIVNCANYAAVSAKDGTTVGGLVGGTEGNANNKVKILGSLNVGSVSGKMMAGGIIGNAKFADVSYCYNSGNISASGSHVGGLLGYIAKIYPSSLHNSYNVGSVKGSSNVGALAGYPDGISTKVSDCYWLEGSAEKGFGGTASISGTNEVKTAADMKTADFVMLINGANSPQESKFIAVEGEYPVHQWQQPAMSDEDAVAAAVDALTMDTSNPVKINLTLPSTGINGTAISWKSGNEAIISHDGVINPPDADTKVTLTATVSKNGIEKIKDFVFTVAAGSDSQDKETVDKAIQILSNNMIPKNGTDTNFITFINSTLEKKNITGVNVKLINPGTPARADVGSIGANGELTYFYQDPSTLGYSTAFVFINDIKLTLSKGNVSKEITVKARLDWDEGQVKDWLNKAVLYTIDWESIKQNNSDQQAVTDSLSLPVRKRDTKNNLLANLTWSSSDTGVVQIAKGELGSDNPIVATVKHQAEDREVVLTVSAESTKALGITGTKTIILKVKGDGKSLSEQGKMQAMLDKHYTEGCLTLVSTGKKIIGPVSSDVMILKHSRDWFDAESGLEFDSKITDPNSESSTRRNYDFTATISDSKYADSGYPRINVYRPLPGQSPATVNVTVSMTKVSDKSISASKKLTFQIAPWEQKELDKAIADATELMGKAKDDYATALLNGTKNTADNITENLAPFRNVTLKDGKPVFSNNISTSAIGLIADEYPGYDPMMVYSGGYRTFKSSQENTISNEMLQLIGKVPEDKQITITAWLTHSELGKYWAKYGAAKNAASEDQEAYKAFKDFYKNEVSATYTVKGTGGEPDPYGTSADINFAFSYDGNFEVQPVPMKVEAGYAAKFGIGSPSTNPTVLDAAVMAHKQKYGDAFTSDSAQNYMDGVLTKLFQHDVTNTFFGHYINGVYSADYANSAKLKDNDVVHVFCYKDNNGDPVANFYKDGNFVSDIITTDGSLTLNLMKAKGYKETKATPADDVQVGVMDKDGKLSGDNIVAMVKSDVDGSFTLKFIENGTFFIMSDHTCDGKDMQPAWCKVTVSGAMTEAEMRELVEQDKNVLAIDGLNTDGTTSSEILGLASQGASGKTLIKWESDTSSVITNKGQIIRDSQNHTVKLRAVISCGSVSESKDFTVNVSALTNDEAEKSLNEAKAKLTTEALAPVEYDGLDLESKMYLINSNELDTILITKAVAIIDNPEIKVTLESSSNSAVDADGKITYGNTEVTGQAVFKLTVGNQTQNHTVDVKVPAHMKNKKEYMEEVAKGLTFEKIKGENDTKDDIKWALLLPNELDMDEKYNETEIIAEWVSDHPEIIKIPSESIVDQNDLNAVYKAEIIRPTVKTTVKLTPMFSYYTEEKSKRGILPPGPMPENMNLEPIVVQVNPLTEEENAAITSTLNEALATIGSEKITAYKDGKDSQKSADLAAVMDDLHLYEFDKNSAYKDSGIRVTWSSSNSAITVNGLSAKVSRPTGTQNAVGQLKVTLFKDNISVSKDFDVTVLADPDGKVKAGILAFMNAITAGYAGKDASWWGRIDSGKFWNAVGMEAYKNYQPDTRNMLSKEAKQAFINKMIAMSVKGDSEAVKNANIQANAINGLSALGYNPTELWTVNHTKFSAVDKLKNINIDSMNNDQKKAYRTIAPYVLSAFRQGDYSTEQQESAHIKFLIEQLNLDANWTIGIDYPAMMMQGLTPYYDRTDVKKALDSAIEKLSAMQGDYGSYGNSNSDAMAIITLAQMGINPANDNRFIKNEKSLLDGMLLYKTKDSKGFSHKQDKDYNDLSTSQGLLGLISVLNVLDTGKAYNVYDFSKTAKTVAYANGTIAGEPDEPEIKPEEGKEITVSFAMKADKGTWIPTTSVTLKKDAKVYHAFVKVLNDAGFTYVGANRNYVSSITNKEGKTLAEFTNGPDSGWLYKVNEKVPNVGLKDYTLANGDKLVWYYTNDWTKDPGAIEAMGGSKSVKITEEKKGTSVGRVVAEAKIDRNGTAAATISDKDISSAIKDMLKKAAESKTNLIKKVSIEVKADDKATKVETTIPKVSVTELNKNVDAVMVNTPLANISMDRETLKNIAENIKGDIKVSAEKADLQKSIMKDEKISKDIKDKIEQKIGNRPVFDFTMHSGNDKVSQFAGKITISIPYKLQANEKPEGIVVYYINQDGTMEKLFDAKYNSGNVEFTTSHFSYYAVGYEEPLKFTDVKAGAWYTEAVDYVVKNNLMNGVSATSFKPDDNTTRAMLATIIYNAEGKQTAKAESSFADVKKDAWYGSSVIWTSEKEIVKGMNQNLFVPTGNVTREQVAVMLYNYAKFKKLNMEVNKAAIENMTDSEKVSTWAKEAVTWTLDKKIMKGKGNNVLDPKGNATRAEIAQMIKNFIEVK